MRTTTIGWTTDAGGATPGIRRPVRTMTEPAHAFSQDAVGAADVARRLRGDGGRLEPQTRLAHGCGGVADDLVGRGPTVAERQVEARQLEIEPEYSGIEDPQCLVEQLLSGLVTVADDDLAAARHTVQSRAKCRRVPARCPTRSQTHALRVGGMPLRPSGPGTTPSTWWMEIPPSSNPLADAAM